MSNWVSSLIHQQDGCIQMVAQHATQGRLRQEQLAQTVARCAAMPSQQNHVEYLRAQLAHLWIVTGPSGPQLAPPICELIASQASFVYVGLQKGLASSKHGCG